MKQVMVAAIAALTAGVVLAQTYRIDINDAAGPVTMPGWTALNASHAGSGGSVTLDGIVFAPFSADGAFLRGSVGSPDPDALYGDGIYDDGSGQAVGILFGGAGDLPAGMWEVSLYSWDADAPGIGNMFASYRINGSEQAVSATVLPSATGPAITFRFESDGVSAYDVFVRENNAENKCRLNAVELRKVEFPLSAYSRTILSQNPLDLYRLHGRLGENGGWLSPNAASIGQSTPTPTLDPAGTPAYAGMGEVNEWANFDGSGGGMLTGIVTGWSSDEGSVSYWVRVDADGAATMTGLMGIKSGGGGAFGSMNDSIGSFQRPNGSCGLTIEGVQAETETGRFGPDEWHHLAMTWNRHTGAGDGVIRVYVDGVEEEAEFARTWDSFVIDEARFGKEISGETRILKGSADEPAIWTRELTQQEIVAQYWHGKRECVNVVFTEGFQGMPADNTSPYTARLDGRNGWVAPSANVVIRNNLQDWTQLGGEWAYAAGGSSPSYRTFGTFAVDAGMLTLEFSGRANGYKSMFAIGQEDAGAFTPLLWFGVDGATMRISAYDGSGTHEPHTDGYSTTENLLVRMRLEVNVSRGTGSMSYYDGAAWQSPAALQDVNLYLRTGRAASRPANWNAVAIAGDPSNFVHDNLVVAYEPASGTLFLVR